MAFGKCLCNKNCIFVFISHSFVFCLVPAQWCYSFHDFASMQHLSFSVSLNLSINQRHCLGPNNKQRTCRLFLSWPVTLWASFCSHFCVSVWLQKPAPSTSFTPLPPLILELYKITVSGAYLSIRQRVNENSLVRCIRGETNFRFQQKGTCECASLCFLLNFSSVFLPSKLSAHLCVHVCALKHLIKAKQLIKTLW